MINKFFTADDYALTVGHIPLLTAQEAADISNNKLEREGLRVYGRANNYGYLEMCEYKDPENGPSKMDTHVGLLINVKELPVTPCEHKSEGKSITNNKYFCFKCGKEVMPSGWIEVDNE